jgi:diaminohydroxyphosphoribosylaminopyrimidine deaminase/5-amino-6-(5-phosphoribosylamino)uracil reductase
MARAIALADGVRTRTSPNPWVGCVLRTHDGVVHEGATAPPGGPHAEVAALARAGVAAAGATVWSTLEPCSHHGRTGPCADALVEAGVARVVVGISTPTTGSPGEGSSGCAGPASPSTSASAPAPWPPSWPRTSCTAGRAGPWSW